MTTHAPPANLSLQAGPSTGGAAAMLRHTTDLGGKNMQSVLDRNDLEELMAMVRDTARVCGVGGATGADALCMLVV